MSPLFHPLLVVHLIGVVVLVGALAVEVIALVGLRLAPTVQSLRSAVYAVPALKVLMPLATILIMVPGTWMAFLGGARWNWNSPWVVTAFVLTVVLAIDGATNLDKRFSVIRVAAAAAPNGPVPADLDALATARGLHFVAWAGLGTTIPFLALMVGHPGWGGSLFVVGVGVAGGLVVAGFLSGLSRRQPAEPTLVD
jgi:hypothetical protein